MSELKKYTGRRRTNPVKLQSSKAAIAGLGIVVTCIFLARSFIYEHSGKEDKSVTLAYSDYYQPSNSESNQDVMKLVEALNKMNNLTCPTTRLRAAAKTLVLNDVSGTDRAWSSPAQYFITSSLYVNAEDVNDPKSPGTAIPWWKYLANVEIPTDDTKVEEVNEYWKGWTRSGNVAFYNLFKGNTTAMDDTGYVPIVAPFSFKFVTANTDGNDIVIISKGGDTKLKIEFRNVLAWFCAAPSEGNVLYSKLEEHTAHGTPLGEGEESYVQEGFAGALIGFADEETTVHAYYHDGYGWTSINLATLYGLQNLPAKTE